MRRHGRAVYNGLKRRFGELVDRNGGQTEVEVLKLTRGGQTDFSRFASTNDEHVEITPRFAGVDVVLDLETACGDPLVSQYIAQQTNHVLVKLPEGARDVTDLGRVTGRAMKEVGDVFADMGKMLDDGVLASVESEQLVRDIDEAIVMLVTLKLMAQSVTKKESGR
jgi:hypothetical protein